ncbi:flagellar hook-basal body protein [Evansella sp. AB-P1]|uniref:flagellar hook-basal body protein n=1 Tax=Evansella sp. AB-P1 TaxID=3037653 RepID=UPI002420153A|nr:flagellar hook-basal body protein [Evansella sp. AB-P1]MDG5787285.1 flagellar hook-basal body protein [Evansella sp. AB-P1]
MISSAVTMGQLQQKLDTIGHNLANSNTTGYKRRETSFSDLLVQQINNQFVNHHEVGRDTPYGIRRGSGAAIAQTAVRFEQGSIQNTDRLLDLAFTEKGYFFELSPTEDGDRRFTRDGAFYFAPNPDNEEENFIVNQNGDYLLNVNGERIGLPAVYDDILIRDNGIIEATVNGDENVVVGQINIVQVTKPQLLTMFGENTFVFPNLEDLDLEMADVLNEAAGAEVIQQRALEMSNVDMGREMTEMLLAQRHYQFNTRAISIADEMRGLVNNLR